MPLVRTVRTLRDDSCLRFVGWGLRAGLGIPAAETWATVAEAQTRARAYCRPADARCAGGVWGLGSAAARNGAWRTSIRISAFIRCTPRTIPSRSWISMNDRCRPSASGRGRVRSWRLLSIASRPVVPSRSASTSSLPSPTGYRLTGPAHRRQSGFTVFQAAFTEMRAHYRRCEWDRTIRQRPLR